MSSWCLPGKKCPNASSEWKATKVCRWVGVHGRKRVRSNAIRTTQSCLLEMKNGRKSSIFDRETQRRDQAGGGSSRRAVHVAYSLRCRNRALPHEAARSDGRRLRRYPETLRHRPLAAFVRADA